MENAKDLCGEEKPTIEENPIPVTEPENVTEPDPSSRHPSRTPFTSLSQIDADLALARTLQEQERAYMMLRVNGGDMSEVDSSEGSYIFEDQMVDLHYSENDENVESEGGGDDDDDDDAFDVHARSADGAELGAGIDPSSFDSDEAYARALQEEEQRELAERMMALAGINDSFVGEPSEDPEEDHGSNSQDTWQEVDPDNLSYEELIALGEVVGTESRGLSADMIASLPSVNYKAQSATDDNIDQCVICRLDYEDGDELIVLSCKHAYHSKCINNWLQINKVCPVCSAEVSTSEDRQGTTSANRQG